MISAPSKIQRNDYYLFIAWNDGSQFNLPSELLRQRCPCAFCKEARGDESHSKPIIGAKKKSSMLQVVKNSKQESVKIEKIWPVGNYAIGILWGDGHSDGIWSWDELKTVCSKNSAAPFEKTGG